MAHILIKYGPNGEREIEAFGFRGDGNRETSDCRQATDFFTKIFGHASDIKAKMDWFKENEERVIESRKRGIDSTKLCG